MKKTQNNENRLMNAVNSTQKIQPTKLVSFDVFDTLLTRRVTNPHSVFYLTGVAAQQERIISCSAETYVRLRKEADTVSRTGQPDWQTDAKSIFNLLTKLLIVTPAQGDRLRELEIEWERKVLVPVPGAKQMLELERNAGYTIAFVSDMYWSSKEIELFLRDADLFKDGDQLLVSADHGACKDSGKLFYKLLEDNPSVKKGEIRHHGNDRFVDYNGALKGGLKGVLHTRGNPTRYERLLEKHREETDGLAPVLSGTGRLLRLLYDKEPAHIAGIARIVGNVVAPTMVMYVLWILQEARNKGIERLCFVSRDGYIPYLICNRISKAMGFTVKTSYIHGSRQSWHLPGLYEFNEVTFNWLLNNFDGSTVETVFKRVGMSWENILQIAPEMSSVFSSPDLPVTADAQKKIKNLIISNKALQKHILSSAKQKRDLLLAYLNEQEINFREKTGIVEIGWAGRTRNSFRRILGVEKADNLHWFYFGLFANINLDQPENISTFIEGLNLQYRSIKGLPTVIESFCFAPHGSVVGFEQCGGKVEPIFNEVGEVELDEWGREKVFMFVEKFCDLLPMNIIESMNYCNLRNPVYNLLNAFISHPSKDDADIWGSIPFTFDQFGKNSLILAPKPHLTLQTIKDALTFGKFDYVAQNKDAGWGAASWAKRDWTLFPLYFFTFVGHMRVKGKSEVHRIFTETKNYIKRLIYLNEHT
jgi:predicted HAD superfamily hydrolase